MATAADLFHSIPPLENGDRLARSEFERRYAAMPGLNKAELIDGVVFIPTAVRYEGHLEGAPELVAEVAASSAACDLHQKLNVYRRHGVRAYLVWRVLPGLWLDAPCLLREDRPAMLRTPEQGVNTPEHSAFVAKRTA